MQPTSAHSFQQCRELWGEPERAAKFNRGAREVRVLKWAAAQTGLGVTLYTTVGVSDEPIGPEDTTHRVELLLGLKPEDDRIARPLGVLGLSSDPSNPHLLHGHSVRNEDPFWPGCPFSAFLLAYPTEPLVPDLSINGTHIRFLSVIPVFPSEIAYKAAHSAEELLALWETVTLPFWSLERSPMPREDGSTSRKGLFQRWWKKLS